MVLIRNYLTFASQYSIFYWRKAFNLLVLIQQTIGKMADLRNRKLYNFLLKL